MPITAIVEFKADLTKVAITDKIFREGIARIRMVKKFTIDSQKW